MLVSYIPVTVSKIKSLLQLSVMQYVVLHAISLPFSLLMSGRLFIFDLVIIIIKVEIRFC